MSRLQKAVSGFLFPFVKISTFSNEKPEIKRYYFVGFSTTNFVIFLKGMNLSLKRSSLPPIVPNFTGRERECNEISCQVKSDLTRLVSIWGSPGFGKTSVAIAVGHQLQSSGLPVYFLSLRGLQSKADLTSKFLGLLRQGLSLPNDQTSQQLSLDDELYQTFGKISDSLVCILDNADDLLETGAPSVKDDIIHLLEEIMRSNEKVKFLLTSRESLQFIDLRFPGHQGWRIGQLDDIFSQELVYKLLPMASASDCKRIAQVCGHVPLAIKLLCSSISEDDPVELSQYLENYLKASADIIQMLDNPDYPSNSRLQVLFGTSFQRLSEEEKRALVSLAILPENFHLDIAAVVLGLTNTARASKILQRLRRKSLLNSGTAHGLFSIHKLIQSFSRDKGEQEMQETVFCAKSRFRAYYVTRFKTLNEKFLRGHSMSAFIEFYEEKQSLTESLIESCSDPKVADDAFDVLATAEQFLDMLLWRDVTSFRNIYDSALEESHKQGKNISYRKLLISKAFGQITWGRTGNTRLLLNEAKECQALSSSVPNEEQGKLLCYLGMHYLVANESEEGVKCFHEALSLMSNIAALVILKLITYQILAVYYQYRKNPASASYYQTKALQECDYADNQHLVIPPSTREPKAPEEETPPKDQANAPLLMQVLYHVSQATENFSDLDTQKGFGNNALKILENCAASCESSLGLFKFHRIVAVMLQEQREYEAAVKFAESTITFHQTALQQFKSNESSLSKEGHELHSVTSSQVHEEALVGVYQDLGQIHYSKGNYSAALQSQRLALDLALAVFGEEHPVTAVCYYLLGWAHHQLEDYMSALPYNELALKIRRKLFGEDNSLTAYSYRSVGYTQHELGDYKSALRSKKRELDIRLKLFGEEDPRTADSYRSLGQTYNEIGDYNAALPLKQHEVAIRLKVCGEEHSKTAASFRSLGYTQHQLGDFNSALQSKQRELDIRMRLLGEEDSKTADSYHSMGETQYQLGDYQSARLSFQRALDIRLKLLGEDHADTAESYHELGVTQHQLGNYPSALQSKQHAVDVRLKLLGEDHLQTAASWHELGITQHEQGDYASARHSLQHALDIRAKLLGEKHAETAKSNHLLEVTHEATL